MSESNVALELLVRAVIQQHRSNVSDPLSDKSHTSIFTEEELELIVGALWLDRYSDNRTNFQRFLGTMIAEKVSKA
jgi:hypothetical protein